MILKTSLILASITTYCNSTQIFFDQPIPQLDLTAVKRARTSKPKTPPGITRSETRLKLGQGQAAARTRSLQDVRENYIDQQLEPTLSQWQGVQNLYKDLLSYNLDDETHHKIVKILVFQEQLAQFHFLEIVNTLLNLRLAPHHLETIAKEVVKINTYDWQSLASFMYDFFKDAKPITPLGAIQFLSTLRMLPSNQWPIFLYHASKLCPHPKQIKSRLMALQKMTLLDERFRLAFLSSFNSHVNPKVSSSTSSFTANFDLWFRLAEQLPFTLEHAFLGFSLFFSEDKEEKIVISTKANEGFLNVYKEMTYNYLIAEKEDGEFREVWLTLIYNTLDYVRDSGHGWRTKVLILDIIKDIPQLKRELLLKLMKTLNAKLGPLKKCHYSILLSLKDTRVEFWQGEFDYVASLLSDPQIYEINDLGLGQLFDVISHLTLSERDQVITITKTLITQYSPTIRFNVQDVVSLLMTIKKIKPNNRQPSLKFLLSHWDQPGFSTKQELWRYLTKVMFLKKPWSKEIETHLIEKLKGK